MHVDAPPRRFLAGMAELTPSATAFVVGGQPGSHVRLGSVSDVAGLDAQQQRKQQGEQHSKRGSGEHQMATQVLWVFDQRSGECTRCTVGRDEDGSSQDVAKTLAFPLRHDPHEGLQGMDLRASIDAPSGVVGGMEEGGARVRELRVGAMIFGLSTTLLCAMFLAPLTLPEGSVPELHGRANALDYATADGALSYGNTARYDPHTDTAVSPEVPFAWTELPTSHAIAYAFGDLNCHNLAERSWTVNGNQMPVCVRDLGIFSGLVVAGAIVHRRSVNRWTVTDTALSILPSTWQDEIYRRRWRHAAFYGFAALTVLPLGLDGFTQLLTDYESTALVRMLTGIPFGVGLGLLFGALLNASPEQFLKASDVRLPGGARFFAVEDE